MTCCLILVLCSLFNMVISNSFSWPLWSYCTYHWAKPEIQVCDDLHGVGVFAVSPLCCCCCIFLFRSQTNTDAFSESAGVVWNNDFYLLYRHGWFFLLLWSTMLDVMYSVINKWVPHPQATKPWWHNRVNKDLCSQLLPKWNRKTKT